jgi:DMSO/TMAO reductase YedYZ molybdopterin-dependent catalytic subunit
MLSHLIQHPPGWFAWPSRPAGLYRLSQGLHVATGIASIPLLLAKLWTVIPRLWTWPPVRSAAHAIERVALVPLVGGSLFLLFSGLASITRWQPWTFSFPRAHYAAAWLAIGGLIVHVGAKAGAALDAVRGHDTVPTDRTDGGLSRRGFLTWVGAVAGGITLATIGQTVRPLAGVSVLAPRDPRVGPQGFPVNKTAASAGVIEAATDASYRLEVTGRVDRTLSLSLDELRRRPQRTAALPIACVDGWSADVVWTGVPLGDLLREAGAPEDADVVVRSLQAQDAPYSSAVLDPPHARDPDTLLALQVDDEPLDIDHGSPVRLIAPSNPGVMQTKWVGRVEVV